MKRNADNSSENSVKRIKTSSIAQNTATSWLSRVRNRLMRPKLTGSVIKRNNVKLPRFSMNRSKKPNAKVNWSARKVNEGSLVQNNVRNRVMPMWLRKQAAYIKGLSEYDFKTLLAFTLNSSVWVGKYERTGNLPNIRNYGMFNAGVLSAANQKKMMQNPNFIVTPLLPQIQKLLGDPAAGLRRLKNNSLHRKVLDVYRADLHRIIRNAPALPANLIVYRGLGTDPFKGSMGTIQHVKGFSSASYQLSKALPYAQFGKDPQLQRIKLLRGTRVIAAAMVNPWESGGQGEIIINSGTRYIVRARNVLRHVLNLRGAPDKMRVTDVTVIPDGPSNKNINKE